MNNFMRFAAYLFLFLFFYISTLIRSYLSSVSTMAVSSGHTAPRKT